jgi:hypothetical protein
MTSQRVCFAWVGLFLWLVIFLILHWIASGELLDPEQYHKVTIRCEDRTVEAWQFRDQWQFRDLQFQQFISFPSTCALVTTH